MSPEMFRPFARPLAHKLLHHHLERHLLRLIKQPDSTAPRTHIKPNQMINAREKRGANDLRRRETGEDEGMHTLVKRAFHEKKRAASEEGGDGRRIARFEGAAFACEDEAVEFGVCGEDGDFAEKVGGEKAAFVKEKAIVDEGLGIAGAIGGDYAESFAEEGKAGGARREMGRGFAVEEEEEEEENWEEEEEEDEGNGIGRRH